MSTSSAFASEASTSSAPPFIMPPPLVDRLAPRLRLPTPQSAASDADATGIRSLHWLKRRLCEAPLGAAWYDFPDIAALAELRPTQRQMTRIRQHLAALDTKCSVSDCIFADRRTMTSITGKSYSLPRLFFLLCTETFDASVAVGSLCPCPPQTFVDGRLVVQSVANVVGHGATPNRVLCCVNPRHCVVRRESAAQKRKRAECETRYDVTPEILAEHLCPLLGGAFICDFERYERRAVPYKRPATAYSQLRIDIYGHERRTMFEMPAGVRAAETPNDNDGDDDDDDDDDDDG